MDKLLGKFYDYLRFNKNLSENTIRSYERDIADFASYCGGDLTGVDPDDIMTYIDTLAHDKANSTVARSMASLRSLYSYLYDNDEININPLNGFRTPKIEKRLPVILSTDEVIKLLDQPETTGFVGLRDKAMLEVLYATGIKVSELVMLNISSVNLKRKMLICAKEENVRVIPIGKEAIKALRDYINNARPECIRDKREQALFLNCHGERITRQGFWKIIKKYKDKAEIDKDITPHMLRHSFAAHLHENGADLETIGEMMGLTDAASMAVYKKIVDNKIFEVYRKAHPRA